MCPIISASLSTSCRSQHSLSVSLVTSLAANNYELQSSLVRCGVLWSLLLFMFEYDYTLDESGVVTDENTNQQVTYIAPFLTTGRTTSICYHFLFLENV